jgi:hypothetical protein
MKLKLERLYLKDTYTIGKLYIDGKYFCDTVEDKVRDLNKDGDLNDLGETKVYGETAIPYGTYEVEVTYSPKFKRELPLIKNVPHFEGIRIHKGNYATNSSGCIITGENKIKGGVINSTPYEIKITSLIKEAQNKGDKITIEIV